MKRIKQILLFVLYLVLMLGSMRLQFEVMKNPSRIWRYNLFSILLFCVVGGLILAVYRSLVHQKKEKTMGSAKQTETFLQVDKGTYQAKIADCGLTKREAEIGFLIASGYSNAMIAKELFIAETTVKKHVSHIFEKTGTGSRKELKEFVTKTKEKI